MKQISFLCPVFNVNPNWLRRCIQSIQRQTYKDWNAVLINDGSTDNRIWEQLVNYSELDKRLTCQYIPHSGVAEALNVGLNLCGDIVSRIDSDDWCEPNRLEVQLKYMEQHGLDLVGSSMFFHTNTGVKPQDPPHGDIRELLAKRIMPIWHPTWLFKKDAIKQYEVDYPHAEDFATLCRISKDIKIGNCPNCLVHKNQHDGRISRIYRDEQRHSAERAIKELL